MEAVEFLPPAQGIPFPLHEREHFERTTAVVRAGARAGYEPRSALADPANAELARYREAMTCYARRS